MSSFSQEAHRAYLLRHADSALVLGQRLSEWCGHAPELEEDLALANIALDLIGQARLLLSYAGEKYDPPRSENELAFLRDGTDFHNVLLVEQPNDDFGVTIARQFLFDAWQIELMRGLMASSDRRLAEIAAKSIKEVSYHLRHSTQWLLRLGDGTQESHQRVQDAVDNLWRFTGELFSMDELDERAVAAGIGVDLNTLREPWQARVAEVLETATLTLPVNDWMASGGKQGEHSEHLGYVLAEMQFMQRAYPGAQW